MFHSYTRSCEKFRYYYPSMVLASRGDATQVWYDLYRPPTSKRAKPIDLFGNATSRTVFETVQELSPDGRKRYADELIIGPRQELFNSSYELILTPTDAMWSALDSKIRTQIKDQKVNLANALGEYKQTADLITSMAVDIYRTFQSLRSGRALDDFIKNLSKPNTRNGKALANRWLQYQYGLKPLMSDIFGTAEELRRKLDAGVYMFANANESFFDEKVIDTPYGVATASAELHLKCKARYKIDSPGLKTASSTGALNPLAVAWELIPWSFVIDWALPVGDWLNGLDATLGISDLKVQHNYKLRRSYTHMAYKPYVDGGGSVLESSGDATVTYTETSRSVVNSLSVGYPRFKNPVSTGHLLNALALIRQLKR